MQPSAQDQAVTTPRWRRAVIRLASLQPRGNPSGLVYGMIVASVVVTAEVHYEASHVQVVVATAATVVVYWLTHVYCHLIGESMGGSTRRLRWQAARHTLGSEATVLWGGGIEVLAITVAYLLGLDSSSGDWVVIAVTTTLLFCWGVVIGVRNEARGRFVLLDAVFAASLGAMVAGLKLLLK
ncbi:hypothetical protein GCM10023145_36620 [Angustibacter luteus]